MIALFSGVDQCGRPTRSGQNDISAEKINYLFLNKK